MSNNDLLVNIKNFQIIKNAELEFKEATISLLVGPSGNGKSSILRAIKTLLLNSSGSQKFIRHGSDSAEVSLKYKGNDIKWVRTKTASKYTVNGEPYSVLGSKNITDILPNNGFVIDDKNDVLSIEGAWQVLFPYDKTGSELFKLFENIFCVSDSGKIFQTFKSEEERVNKELQEQKNNLDRNKSKLQTIDALFDRVDIDKLRALKELLISLDNKYNKTYTDLNVLKSIHSYINVVREDLKINKFSNDLLLEYSDMYKNVSIIKDIILFLKLIKGIDTKQKIFKTDNISSYESILCDITKIREASLYPRPKGEIKDFSKDNINDYASLKKNLEVLNSTIVYTDLIKNNKIKTFDNSSIIEYNKDKRNMDTLRVLSKELKELKSKKDSIEEELKVVNEELEKFKVCPTCGSILTK